MLSITQLSTSEPPNLPNAGARLAIRCGLSEAFLNKQNRTGFQSAFGSSFYPRSVTPRVFIDHALAGKAYTVGYFQGNRRTNETFISAGLIALDCDHNVSVADALKDPFIRQYALLVYATPSSTPDNYRTRIVFRLSEAIEGTERYRAIVAGLIRHLGLDIDPASVKPAQLYYGSTNRIEAPYDNERAVLPLALLGALTADLAREDYAAHRHRMESICIPVMGERAERRAYSTLNTQLTKLASAPDGSRNETLYKTAWFLFSAANGNWPGLDAATVQRELEAIVRSWPNVHKSLDTIQRAQHNAGEIPLVDTLPAGAGQSEIEPFTEAGGTEIVADLRCWPAGVPDKVRKALRKYYAMPTMRLFIEFINTAVARHLIDPDEITVQAILDTAPGLGYHFKERTILRLLDTSFFEFTPNSAIEETRDTTNARFGGNPNGRPANTYRWLPIGAFMREFLRCAAKRIFEKHHLFDPNNPEGSAVILADVTADMLKDSGLPESVAIADAVTLTEYLKPAYEKQNGAQHRATAAARRELTDLAESLKDATSTPLPDGWQYHNWKDHAAAQVRAYVQARENSQKPYAFWQHWLGVAEGEVSEILKRAGIHNERQTVQADIRAGADLVEQVNQHARERGGHPETLLIAYPSGKTSSIEYQFVRKDPAALNRARSDVINHLANGATVTLELRTASRQIIETDDQPAQPAKPTSTAAPAVKPSGKTDAPAVQKRSVLIEREDRYTPEFLRLEWLRAMELLGWLQYHTDDGEQWLISQQGYGNVRADATPRELLAALLDDAGVGQSPPDTVPQEEIDSDPFLAVAAELGAVIRKVEHDAELQ